MTTKIYNKNQLNEFINDFNNMSIKEKYSTIVKISSRYYGLEINGLFIEKISSDEIQNILKIIAHNNRRTELRIVDDLEIEIMLDDL